MRYLTLTLLITGCTGSGIGGPKTPTLTGGYGTQPTGPGTGTNNGGCATPTTWFRDGDGDGFGLGVDSTSSCDQPAGFAALSGDCDDSDPNVYPGAAALEDSSLCTSDGDGDGYGDSTPGGLFTPGTDCDDTDPAIYPNAPESCMPSMVDEDCDGLMNEADAADSVDAVLAYDDLDGDGYGDENGVGVLYCQVPAGTQPTNTDCDDSDWNVYPGAPEVCEPFGIDEDCDGAADNADAVGAINAILTWEDNDLDGDGDPYSVPDEVCTPAYGWSPTNGDCDDSDPTIYAGAPDIPLDGIDQDCNGVDNDGTFFDDFELGTVKPTVFASLTGDGAVQSTYKANGLYALNLGGGIATAETQNFDATMCGAGIYWEFLGKRGPELPDAGDNVTISYWNGFSWVVDDTWLGGATDPGFTARGNLITDPAAFRSDLRLRLVSNGSGAGTDDFFIDDFTMYCYDDTDGDGVTDLQDCAPLDAAHWSDCGFCTDVDNDDYGTNCDLGADCNDFNPNVNPEGIDLSVNGVDEDCNGFDGPQVYFDDFDAGALNTLWASLIGDGAVTSSYSYSGSYSLNMGGGIATATTVTLSTMACNGGITVSWMGKRGPETPDAGEDILVDWSTDGVFWTNAGAWAGGGITDVGFTPQGFLIGNPAAQAANFSVRLMNSGGSGASFDDFFIDDFLIDCLP